VIVRVQRNRLLESFHGPMIHAFPVDLYSPPSSFVKSPHALPAKELRNPAEAKIPQFCVGAPRFELGTSRTRTVRSTGLSHAPKAGDIILPSRQLGKQRHQGSRVISWLYT
jgi:hypothetical protein